MNKSLIKNVNCEAARKLIYHLTLQIEALNLKIDRLEQQIQPTQAIGFHVKESEKQLYTAFKNIRHNVPD